jgi:hypothetical protein
LKGTIGSAAAAAGESSSTDEDLMEGVEEGTSFGDLVPFGDPYWYQDWSSPFYNESHRKLRAYVRKFVENEIKPYCYEWDEAKAIPKSIFKKAGE